MEPRDKKSETTESNTGPENDIDEPRPSTLANEVAFDVGEAYRAEEEAGTIVTDKKSRKHSLISSIGEAAREWTGDKADYIQHLEVFQKPRVAKVQPGTERKEVVEKAVARKPLVERDDHKSVLERIRTYQRDAERITGKPLAIKPRDETRAPRWTHILGLTTEENTGGENLTESAPPVRREQVIPSENVKVLASEVTEHSGKTIEDYEEKKPVHTTRENITPNDSQSRIAPTAKQHVGMPRQELKPMTRTPVESPPPANLPTISPKPSEKPARPTPPPPPTPRMPRQETPPPPAPKPSAPVKLPFNWRHILVLFIALAILCGTGFGVYYFFFTEETVEQSQNMASAGLRVTLTPPPETLLADIRNILHTTEGEGVTVQLVTPAVSEAPAQIATAEEFFAILEPRAPRTLLRSFEHTMVVGGVRTDTTVPYLVFKTRAFDTAFAGMLAWEPFMSTDFAPLFGAPVTGSVPPNAPTSTPPVTPRFVDRTIAGHNARVLYDEMGREALIYSFTDKETLIITANPAALEAVLEQL